MNWFTVVVLVSFSFLGNNALDETCSVTEDCKTQLAVCENGQCKCPLLYYPKDGQCLQYAIEYQGFCKESQQCTEWLGTNSECKNDQCICTKGFVWYQGKCQVVARKGETCDASKLCFDEQDMRSMKCDQGKCTCNEGFYDRGPDCRRLSTKDNACTLNMDCQKPLVCYSGKCTDKKKTKSFSAEEKEIFLTAFNMTKKSRSRRRKTDFVTAGSADFPSCQIDKDCSKIANSKCSSQQMKCVCQENTFLFNNNCIPGFKLCKANDDCDVKNTICFKEATCVCDKGYFWQDGVCVPELGVNDPSLKSINDCKIRPSAFDQNTCYCRDYWIPDNAKRSCLKSTNQQFTNCMNNENCKVLGPYACCKNRKCVCSNSNIDEEKFYCENDKRKTDAECIADDECKANEFCNGTKCECIENFQKDNNGTCRPDKDESCLRYDCIEKLSCIDGYCGCSRDAFAKSGECLTYTKSLGELCEVDEQCKNLKYSNCRESIIIDTSSTMNPDDFSSNVNLISNTSSIKTCQCRDDYLSDDNICIKIRAIGDPCMTDYECTKTINHSFQCRNSKCQCPLGNKLTNGYCSSAAQLFSRITTVIPLLLTVTLSSWIFSQINNN